MEKNYQEAIKWLRMAAEKGNAEAQYKLGMILCEEGLELLKQSMAQDYKESGLYLISYKKMVDEAVGGKKNRAATKNNAAKGSFGNVKVGDIIKFGNYPQNNGDIPEPVEWQVLMVENGRALVISKYALDGGKPYNEKFENITWKKCTLRKWLNNDFLNKAFNGHEQDQIILADISADKNPNNSTPPGNNTKDKLFLLSIKEVRELFKNDEARVCYTTKYAKKTGSVPDASERVWWWLRSPGNIRNFAAYVSDVGLVNIYGDDVLNDNGAVRPAFYLNLKS